MAIQKTLICVSKALVRDKRQVEGLGRSANSALRVLDTFARFPVLSINQAAGLTNVSYPTAASAIARLTREFTGMSRNRVYVYDEYIRVLSEGTETL